MEKHLGRKMTAVLFVGGLLAGGMPAQARGQKKP